MQPNPHEQPTVPPAESLDPKLVPPPPDPETIDQPPNTGPFPTSQPDPFTKLPSTFGRYRLLRLLGKGGMGAVYLAHDTQLDRKVALKVPSFAGSDGPQARERFLREARAAATVHHANLCPVYDVGEIAGSLFLTMAFLEGKTLHEVLKASRGPLSERQAGALLRKLALALSEAHRKKVIHRDLKPGNIMISPRGEPIIMDFGLARRGGRQHPLTASDATFMPSRPVVDLRDEHLTRIGQILGTPAYMAPEQAMGNPEEMGPACDIYSLGVILYELLTGRLPFQGDAIAILGQLLEDEPMPPSAHCSGLDPKMEAICLKAMAKKPESRYRTMGEFAGVLTDYLKGGQPPAGNLTQEEPSFPEVETMADQPAPPRGQFPVWAAVLLSGAAGVAVLVGLTLWMRDGRKEPAADQATLPQNEKQAARPQAAGKQDQTTDRVQAESALARARQLHQKGDHASAADEASKAIQLDPNLAGAYTVRAAARANVGQVGQAIDDLTRAVLLNPKDDAAFASRARHYEAKNDLDRALADHNTYLKLKPRDPEGHITRGKLHLRKGDPEKARADFYQAVKLEPRLSAKLPVIPAPALVWPAEALRKGQLTAPKFGRAKPWFSFDFKKKEGGLPSDANGNYGANGYVIQKTGGPVRTVMLPKDKTLPANFVGPFACELVGRSDGPLARWGVLVSQGGSQVFSVSISVPGVVFYRERPGSKLTQIEPEPGKHPAVHKKTGRGIGQTNRLLVVVTGRYLEAYVNDKAVSDPILLPHDVMAPEIGLIVGGGQKATATAEFERIVVRPADSLGPLPTRGAKAKDEPRTK